VEALASAHFRLVGGPGPEPARKGAHPGMEKLIGVVDLSSGTVTDRPVDSLTLDIPPDLDSAAGSVSLSVDNVARYVTASGQKRSYLAHPTALSRRARGEECLVAAVDVDKGPETSTRSYQIAMVDVDD